MGRPQLQQADGSPIFVARFGKRTKQQCAKPISCAKTYSYILGSVFLPLLNNRNVSFCFMLLHFLSRITGVLILIMAIMKFVGHKFQIHGAVFVCTRNILSSKKMPF